MRPAFGHPLLGAPGTAPLQGDYPRPAAMNLAEEWPWGTAEDLHAVSEELARTGRADIHETDRAYHRLFVGPRKLAAPPWGSVYLDSEAVVFGDSCLAISRWMRAQGIELHEAESREPIDHIGRMLALLSWLASQSPRTRWRVSGQHLLPGADLSRKAQQRS